MRTPRCMLVVGLLLCGSAVMAQDSLPKQPKFLVIQGIQEDANYVMKAKNPDDVLKQDSIEDYDYKSIDAVQGRAAKCLQKIKQLFDSGTPPTEEITIETGNTTLGALSETMLDIDHKAIYIGVIDKLEQSAMRAKNWVEDVGQKGKLTYVQLDTAAADGDKLEKAVVAAQKFGFPADYKIHFWKNSYTLPELKEMGHYVSTAGGQLKKAIDAQRAAKDAPFLKLLKGDKLRIFQEEFAGQSGMFEALTSGGKELTTPEAMNAATVWYTWGNSNGFITTWHVTGWKFDGDKLVGNTSRGGFGVKPSAAAFR
jgi:uncharacterized lipoprotein YehR (DUF1307 family)